MSFYKFPAEIQPQTRSTNPIGAGIIRSYKATKDICLLVRRNTYTLISDTQECQTFLFIFADAHINRSSLRTIFNRIVDEIAQDLLNAPWVEIDHKVLH